jgi:putative flippase GtrA
MMVGVACAAIHNGVMFACDILGVQYLFALVISFAILAPSGYTLHSLFTFRRSLEMRRFLRFTAGILTGFPVNLLLMVLLVTGMRIKVPIATVLCTGLLFVWNYLAARWAITRSAFRHRNALLDI